MPEPTSFVRLTVNPAAVLIADAAYQLRRAQAAARRSLASEPVAARASILLHLLAIEAFINAVWVCAGDREPKDLQRLSARDKWLKASLECLPTQGRIHGPSRVRYRPGDPVRTFREASRLFCTYLELREIRNAVCHLKPETHFVKAEALRRTTSKARRYPLTHIPVAIASWRYEHARRVAFEVSRLVSSLDGFMKGTVGRLAYAPQSVEFLIASYPSRHSA